MADITVTAAQVGAVFPEKAEIVDMIAAEALTAGQAVYQVAASGKAGLADANAAGQQQFRGIALNAAGAGQAVSVLKKGHVYGFDLSGMDYDDPAYLSDTAGTLADAAGTMSVNAGRVVALPDASASKVLYVEADWLRTWA
jgi:hypothetical protein